MIDQSDLPPELLQAVLDLNDHIAARFLALSDKWPEKKDFIASNAVAIAVACTEQLGFSVEAILRQIRGNAPPTVTGKFFAPEVLPEWERIATERRARMADFVNRWPNYRLEAAQALMIDAIVFGQMMNLDVDAWFDIARNHLDRVRPTDFPKSS